MSETTGICLVEDGLYAEDLVPEVLELEGAEPEPDDIPTMVTTLPPTLPPMLPPTIPVRFTAFETRDPGFMAAILLGVAIAVFVTLLFAGDVSVWVCR